MKTNQIIYTQINGINYPKLALPKQPNVNIGKYGQLRHDFLKKHRRGTYTTLLTEGKLAEHLANTDEEARSMVDSLTLKLAKKQGIDEHLKILVNKSLFTVCYVTPYPFLLIDWYCDNITELNKNI